MRSSNSLCMRSISSCGVSLTDASGAGPAVSHVTLMPQSPKSNSAQSLRSRLRSQEPNELLSLSTISLSFATGKPSGSTAHMMSGHFRYLAAARRRLPPKTTYLPSYGTTIHPRASTSSGVFFMLFASLLSSRSVHSLGLGGRPGICPVLKYRRPRCIFLKSMFCYFMPCRPLCHSSPGSC